MIKCKKCKMTINRQTVKWEVIFHGSLIKKEGKCVLEPWGENDYVNSLTLECDNCGREVKLTVNEEEITHEHIEEAVKKFMGIVR